MSEALILGGYAGGSINLAEVYVIDSGFVKEFKGMQTRYEKKTLRGYILILHTNLYCLSYFSKGMGRGCDCRGKYKFRFKKF